MLIKRALFSFIVLNFSLSMPTISPPFLQYKIDADGFIRSWLVLGPFSNSAPGVTGVGEHGEGCFGFHHDLLVNAGGEADANPAAGETVQTMAGERRTWQLFFSTSEWIDFNTYFSPNDDVAAYAFVVLSVEKDTPVSFGLSHNDGMKVWLNGELVYAEHPAHLALNSVSLPAILSRGDNRLLVKVDEKKGEWGFALSVRPTSEGEKLDVTVKLAASNRSDDLAALLFEAAALQNAELLEHEPLCLTFPMAGLLLPGTVDLPLVLLKADGQQMKTQTVELNRVLATTYPLSWKLSPGEYQLALKGRPDIPPKPLRIVGKKVFNRDPEQSVGQRPYEMGDRPGASDPLVDFEDLTGWWIRSQNGASARMYRSRVQQMDGQFVARVIYRGDRGASAFEFGPPQPIPISADADHVGLWVYGNNWGWAPDPSTPQVTVQVILVDDSNTRKILTLAKVNWKEWFLLWRKFQPGQKPWYFKSIRVLGCSNVQERQLFFDSLHFGREAWPPLDIEPLPDWLPFLTTPETILPTPSEQVQSQSRRDGDKFIARCRQSGLDMIYEYTPSSGTLNDFIIRTGSGQVITPFVNGDVDFLLPHSEREQPEKRTLQRVEPKDNGIVYYWLFRQGKVSIPYRIKIAARYNSLLIDIAVLSERARGLSFGSLRSNRSCKLVRVPMLSYGLPDPQVVCTGDVFVFALLDHYRSHASKLYARNDILSDNEVVFNGGSRYFPKTDGKRNRLSERIVLSISPNFHDVLPNIPHPPSPMGDVTRTRLWKENWGLPPDSTAYEKFYRALKLLRDYGISQFIVRHHEETWRDGGESFTLRLKAAPKKGGDAALIDYVRRVKELGFICGLYTNYIDFAPVNANWSPDRVSRNPDGNFVPAWARCYTLKPILAPKFEAEYAPAIHRKFGPNTVYCDVHTAVTPWSRVDFDERVPEAGQFRAQHKAYSLLLNNEKKAYQGPVFSEGLYHWFYAGLTDGNYGQLRDSQPPEVPPLVDFDLLRIHPLEVDIGMGNPGMFYRAGLKPEQRHSRSSAFDRFLATTIAYGHNGYLIDIPIIDDLAKMNYHSNWGIPAILKSYYMMQQLQSRYALQKVERIAYFDGREWVDTNRAVREDSYRRGQIRTRYASGLETVVNLNRHDTLIAEIGEYEFVLPANGYAAVGKDFYEFSGLEDDRRVDVVFSPEYLYADGRGKALKTENMAVTNSAVVLKDKGSVWLIPIDEKEQVRFRPSALGLGAPIRVHPCDQDGRPLNQPVDYEWKDGWLTVHLRAKIFKYQIVAHGRR